MELEGGRRGKGNKFSASPDSVKLLCAALRDGWTKCLSSNLFYLLAPRHFQRPLSPGPHYVLHEMWRTFAVQSGKTQHNTKLYIYSPSLFPHRLIHFSLWWVSKSQKNHNKCVTIIMRHFLLGSRKARKKILSAPHSGPSASLLPAH